MLSLANWLPVGWIVHSTIQAEIDALAREELEETRAYFHDHMLTVDEFAEASLHMIHDHPQNRLAWRIWEDASGEQWTELGPEELLEYAPPARPAQSGVEAPEQHVHVASGVLDGGLTAAVVLDASYQAGRFGRFLLEAAGAVLLATCVATLAGHLVGLRVSRLLAEVAECARTEEAVEHWPSPGTAPQEIQDVVRALQDTLRRIREETENARLLTSGMAHELRSPLQNLMGETQVALLREREPGEYRRVLESHLEDLAQLSRVVDNLVTMSSLEEARRRRSLESFDLAAEARLRLSREQQLASRRGVALELVSEGSLRVEGDRESLLLALRNLVTNAIQWSPPGKTVEVRMSA